MLTSNNVINGKGAAREGIALLPGLLHCRRCGRKLVVNYGGANNDVPRYCCHRGYLDNGEPKCISFGGLPIDRAISEQVLRVVKPAAMEAAVLAHQQESEHREEVLQALQRELEAARYEATRAQRQFDAADPDNRLVTSELERRWNAALVRAAEVEDRIQQHHAHHTSHEQIQAQEFATLANDLESVWNNPDADIRLKKRIVRELIQDVIVDIDNEASDVVVVIHWAGGVHTELRVPRRRRGKATATDVKAIEAVRSLARICTDDMIASYLNRNGLVTGRGNRFTRERIISLRSYHKIPIHSTAAQHEAGWMNLSEASKFVGVTNRTLRLAIERGDIPAEHPLPDGPWVLNRNDLETPTAKMIADKAKNRRTTPAVPDPDQKTLGF